LNVAFEKVQELKPGHAVIVKKDGTFSEEEIVEPKERTACSFERIYFSRGNDADIYKERNALGRNLVDSVLKAIDHDLENTVFSYIPNTAEVAFGGLIDGLHRYCDKVKMDRISKNKNMADAELKKILDMHPRVHKVILRTPNNAHLLPPTKPVIVW
jgi:amidophosphoribosyltransferase